GVGTQCAMWKQRHTVALPVANAGQLCRVDHILGDIGSVVEVNAFVEDHDVSRPPGTACVGRIEDPAVDDQVVEQARGNGRSTRDQSQKARKRIRVGGRTRVREGDTVTRQFSEGRTGVVLYIISNIERMQAIDAYEQNVLKMGALAVVGG